MQQEITGAQLADPRRRPQVPRRRSPRRSARSGAARRTS